MNKKIVLCVILSCLVFLTVLSSCEPKIEKKYEVLFAGSSDSASALLIPLDFEEIEYDTKARDTDLWPDEMTIEFEGVSYDCYLKYFLGDNCCREPLLSNDNLCLHHLYVLHPFPGDLSYHDRLSFH